MADLKDIAKFGDNSIRQLVFFYELTKMGAVRFDVNNKLHMETLNAMIDKLVGLQGMDMSEKPLYNQMEHQNRLWLYKLIMFNIFRYSEKQDTK